VPDVIYTAIFGGYDRLRPLPEEVVASGCRAICFTDSEVGPSPGWEIRYASRPRDTSCRAARWFKLNPFHVFPDVGSTLWMDANLEMCEAVPQFSSQAVFAVDDHPDRNCLYSEAGLCRKLGLDYAATFDRQVECYRACGMPNGWGLWETNIVFARRCAQTETVFRDWWRNVDSFSCRDQVSLPFVLWQIGERPSALDRSGIRRHDHAKPRERV